MICVVCGKEYAQGEVRCPRCGEGNAGPGSGVFQTSTVLISTGAEELVYSSVDEVPAGLRSKLLRSTNGANSATILIADRRGRREIAKAMRNLPGPVQRRLRRSAVAGSERSATGWLTSGRRSVILAILASLLLAFTAIVFLHARP